jgi:predicted ArsR family transcriptional regulator
MARAVYGAHTEWTESQLERLKQFEALVRADEREACAKVCESEAEMFKSCAEGANDGRYDWKEDGARDCAYAIRARGETK